MASLVVHSGYLITVLLVIHTTGGCQQQVGAASQHKAESSDTETLVATGTMATARAAHTATTLPDGRLLVAGGFTVTEGSLAGAELYDPASGTFSPAGHVAVSLTDGRVLIAGGVGTGWTFLASAEVYDPARGTFTSTSSMATPRESHTAVRLTNGRVLVAGGHQGRGSNIELYTSAEIFDPATGTFHSTSDMNVRRHKHDAVLLSDGRVLITGGTDERDHGGRYTSAEIFDPANQKWTLTGSMQLPRYKHAGTSFLLPSGRVVILGGSTQAEVYDPAKGNFTLVQGDARMPGQSSAAALLESGGALVTGGYGERSGP